MKQRIKNLITSIIGGLLMITGVAMIVSTYFINAYTFKVTEYLSILVLGWVFLMAKDTLIEGIFLNIFKVKK